MLQWQRFVPYLGNISRQAGRDTFGVSYNGDDEGNFDYIAGVEVTDFSDLPAGFSRVRIGPQRYAVFSHREHISTIRRTIMTIWSKWLPESGHEVADAPNFERTATSSIPRPEWVASKSGYRSRRDATRNGPRYARVLHRRRIHLM